MGDVPATSPNTPSLTAHAAHTVVSKLLISLYCHSCPSRAPHKTYVEKAVFSRLSSLFSSVHCTHGAHGTGCHGTRFLWSKPSSLHNLTRTEFNRSIRCMLDVEIHQVCSTELRKASSSHTKDLSKYRGESCASRIWTRSAASGTWACTPVCANTPSMPNVTAPSIS